MPSLTTSQIHSQLISQQIDTRTRQVVLAFLNGASEPAALSGAPPRSRSARRPRARAAAAPTPKPELTLDPRLARRIVAQRAAV
ncbi:MAG: hypothetical protein ABW321_19765, partial [Polyangiales bacterium]